MRRKRLRTSFGAFAVSCLRSASLDAPRIVLYLLCQWSTFYEDCAELLLSQVKNTMPYLFAPEAGGTPLSHFPAACILREYEKSAPETLSHFEYFKLCVSSHYLTYETPLYLLMSTDRFARRFGQLSFHWRTLFEWPISFSRVATGILPKSLPVYIWSRRKSLAEKIAERTFGRVVYDVGGSLLRPQAISRSARQEKRQLLFDSIRDEVHRHSEIFGSLWRANDGLTF